MSDLIRLLAANGGFSINEGKFIEKKKEKVIKILRRGEDQYD